MKNLNKLIEIYQKRIDSDEKIINYLSPPELKQSFPIEIREEGVSDEQLLKIFQKFLHFSPNTVHPQFNNQLYGGFNETAFLAEVLSFLTNTSMATFEISPVATLMEKEVISEIAKKINFSTYDGTMLTGGSNANMMAIHFARVALIPNFNKEGSDKRFSIFVSEEAHYSFTKAAMLLGMGSDSVVKVKTNKNLQIDISDLELAINEEKKAGRVPLILATTSGTTVYGAFDNIRESNLIAKKYNLWHHVDGAWGGVCVFNDSVKEKLDGIELVDSFAIDFHKLFGTGLITSFLITKDKNILEQSCSSTDGEYLFHEYEASEFDLGKKTIQCGKKNDALKAWAFYKSVGQAGLSKILDSAFELRDYTLEKIKGEANFELLLEPEFLNICFRSRLSNSKTRRYELIQEGRAMVNFSTDKNGDPFIRLTLANNKTTRKEVDELLEWLL